MLGVPIEHSLSPALHRAAYAALGLSGWSYDRYEVGADELAAFVAGCDDTWRGLSLTMPLKEVALGLGEAHPDAARVGAANTLIFDADRVRLYNTDVGGLVAALADAGVTAASSVTILGAGGTARSALASAAQLGARTATVVARSPAKATALDGLAAGLGVTLAVQAWSERLPTGDLLISTAPAGAVDERAPEVAAAAPVIFDAIYHPWPTPLAAAAEAAGATVVSGLDLLVGQAVLQIELMTGQLVDPALLRSAGRAALSARSAA